MSVLDNAIVKLQAHALALATITIKGAPSYPTEDAAVLPLAIAHVADGTGQADESTTCRMLVNLHVDFHVSRVTMKSSYTQINLIIPEFLERLAGDPTLGATVDTIVFPVSFAVSAVQWNTIPTQMVSFTIPVKYRESPIT